MQECSEHDGDDGQTPEECGEGSRRSEVTKANRIVAMARICSRMATTISSVNGRATRREESK